MLEHIVKASLHIYEDQAFYSGKALKKASLLIGGYSTAVDQLKGPSRQIEFAQK